MMYYMIFLFICFTNISNKAIYGLISWQTWHQWPIKLVPCQKTFDTNDGVSLVQNPCRYIYKAIFWLVDFDV